MFAKRAKAKGIHKTYAKVKKSQFALIVTITFLFSIILISSQNTFSADLEKGKNIVYINISEPIYVDALVKLNPEIQVISFTENNQTTGYVNVFGGVGKNFIVEARTYEIITSKQIKLVLPD